MITSSTQHHWQGFTQMEGHQPIEIRSAEGAWLQTSDGRRLFDGVSNLWCNVHGHNHPAINSAIEQQLHQVAHVTTLGLASETTNVLATKLSEITPGNLTHCFFSSDGSSAVEAALKMAFQYWQQRGDPKPDKTKYLAMGGAYHGDTTGAVSLGGIKYFHKLFAPILFSPLRAPLPCTYRLPDGVTLAGAAEYYAGQIETLLLREHQNVAAVVIEPLVQGAAGMITHPPGLLSRVRSLCDRYDVLMIADEVAVGFGRTGRLFACRHESVTPDIMCMGKGLTAGYLPLAATIATPSIFEAFLGTAEQSRQFFHGHTFGGNPLAAAAALASIEIFEQDGFQNDVNEKMDRLRNRLNTLASNERVGSVRGRGGMIGIEIVSDSKSRSPFATELQMGRRICESAIRRGVWLRPLGDVVIVMPPFCSREEDLQMLSDVVIDAVNEVCSLVAA